MECYESNEFDLPVRDVWRVQVIRLLKSEDSRVLSIWSTDFVTSYTKNLKKLGQQTKSICLFFLSIEKIIGNMYRKKYNSKIKI